MAIPYYVKCIFYINGVILPKYYTDIIWSFLFSLSPPIKKYIYVLNLLELYGIWIKQILYLYICILSATYLNY